MSCRIRLLGLAVSSWLLSVAWVEGAAAIAPGPSPIPTAAIAQSPVAATDTLRLEGEKLNYAGEFAAALETLQQALAAAQQAGDRERVAAVQVALAEVYLSLNDKAAAAAVVQQALTEARSLSAPSLEAEALRVLAFTQFEETPNETAIATIQSALVLAQAAGTPHQQGITLVDYGVLQILRQEFGAGLQSINQGQTLLATSPTTEHERARQIYYEPLILAWSGLAKFGQGSPKPGLQLVNEAIALSQSTANPVAEGVAYLFRGFLLAGQGDSTNAAMAYRRAAGIFATVSSDSSQREALRALANLYTEQASGWAEAERWDEAIAGYERAIAVYVEMQNLAAATDDAEEVARALHQIANIYGSLGYTMSQQAAAAFAAEQPDRALQHSQAAIDWAQQGVDSALAANQLTADSQDASLRQESYQAVHLAHLNLGGLYDAQAVLHQALGQSAEVLATYQKSLQIRQAGLSYALESANPEWIARARYQLASTYIGISHISNAMGNYEAGIDNSQEALALAQQVPSRGMTLLALNVLQQQYHDGSGALRSAGNYEAAIAYANEAIAAVERAKAIADLPLENPDALPAAALLPNSSTIDTESERQEWQTDTASQLWLAHAQLAFIYDEQEIYDKALEHFYEALAYVEQLGDLQRVSITLGIISVTHVQLSQYPEALAIQERIGALAAQMGNEARLFSAKLGLATIYDDLGRYPEAIAVYEEVLEMARAQGALSDEQTALNNLGTIYTYQGQYDAALANYDAGLTITRSIRAALEAPDGLERMAEFCYLDSPAVSPDVTTDADESDTYDAALGTYIDQLTAEGLEYNRQSCISTTWNSEHKLLNNIAVVYTDQGRYQEAIALFEESLTIIEDWGNRVERADTLNNLGNAYLYKGEYQTAIALYEEALAIRREIGDRAGRVSSLNSLGTAYSWQGQYLQADAAYQEALTLVREIGLKPSEPSLLGNIGVIYADQGRYAAAQTQYETSLAQAQALGLLPDQSVQLAHLSDLAFVRGNYPQALDFAEQSLEIYQTIGARIGEATVVGKIGTIHRAQGNFAEALERHQSALALAEALEDRDDQAYSLLALGSTYSRLGQYDPAEQYYQEALAQFRSIGHRAGEADALRNQGTIAEQRSRPDAALALYEQALKIYQDIGSVEGEYLSLIDIGNVQATLGQLAAAESSLQTALDIQRQIGARASEGQTLAVLARVRQAQGDTAAALELLQSALALHRELGDRPHTASTLSDLGRLLAERDQPELAVVFLKESVNVYESIRGELSGLEMELQASYTESIAGAYRTLADLLLSQGRILEAQRVLDLLKVQELDEYFRDVQRSAETQNGIAFWQVETDLLALYQQVLAQATELQQLEAKPASALTPAEQQRLAALRTTRDEAEGWFYDFLDDPDVIDTVDQIRASTRGQNLEPENFLDLANNLRQLPQKTAAFYPLILEDRLELVLIMPEGPPLRYPVAVSAQELNQAIVDFGQALKNPGSNIEPLAQQLYGWLVAPVAEQLAQADIESIIYAPDGALRYVPLAALHDGEHYLAEQFSISHITAASLTDINLPPRNQNRRLLAAACAECSFTVSVDDREFSFSDLPFTAVEVENIAKQVNSADVLLNQDFSATALSSLPQYGIIHLATHAAFVTGSPDESFILFGSGETINLRDIKREWQLDNAELVVLSACETAVGSTDLGSGIEILGLGYRIEQAGAQATLASLWQVSDGGTQALMNGFYSALQQGMTKAEALQAAQQALITSDFSAVGGDRGIAVLSSTSESGPFRSNGLSHPYYWAPFILIGNGL